MTQQDLVISLHAGAHKTATTHLQETLASNKALLDEAGIQFRGPGYFRKEDRSLSRTFQIDLKSGVPPLDGSLARLKDLAGGQSRLIMSEENFFGRLNTPDGSFRRLLYPYAPKRLRTLANRISPYPIDLFFAVRDPAAFMQSAYSQTLLSGRKVSLDDYLGGMSPGNVSWFRLIRQLVKSKAARRIWIWRYEDYPSIQQQIYSHLLTPQIAPSIVPHPGHANQGLSYTAVEACLSDDPDSPTGPVARELYPVGDDHPRYNAFSLKERGSSQLRYEEDLSRIEELPEVRVLKT